MGSVRQDKATTPHAKTQCPECRESLASMAQLSLSFCPHCRFPLMEIAGKYTIQKRLATGGFGAVYLAHHKDLTHHPERVIKIIRAELFATSSIKERFQREVQITAQLSQASPHIVRVYDDFGESEKLGYYYVMEYLHGRSLRSQLEASQGPLPPAQISHLFAQLCDAIQTAHDAQILHRDLKPENILLISHRGDPHFLKVLDFGIAKPMHHEYDSLEAVTEDPLGTPAYMAPEQCLNRDVGPHTDIYALGVLLYELLTGVTPFPWEGRGGLSGLSVSHNLLYAHIHQSPPPLHLRCPALAEAPALEAIVQKALAKQPHERYHSANELWQALQPVLADDALLRATETAAASHQEQPSVSRHQTPAHRRPWSPTLAPEDPLPSLSTQAPAAWMAPTEDAPQGQEDALPIQVADEPVRPKEDAARASIFQPTAPPRPLNGIEKASPHKSDHPPHVTAGSGLALPSRPKSSHASGIVLPTPSTAAPQAARPLGSDGRAVPDPRLLETDRPFHKTRQHLRIAAASLCLFAIGSALGLWYYRSQPPAKTHHALAPLYRDTPTPRTQHRPHSKKPIAKAVQRKKPRLLSAHHPLLGSPPSPQVPGASPTQPTARPTRDRTPRPWARHRQRPRRTPRDVRRAPKRRRSPKSAPRRGHRKPARTRQPAGGRLVKQCPRLAGYYWVYVRFLSAQQRRAVQPVLPAGGRRKRLKGGDCFGVKKPSHAIAFGRSSRGYVPCHLFPGKARPTIQLKLQKEGDGLEPDTKTYCIK